MNGSSAILETNPTNFPATITENDVTETLIFEEIKLETITVSEIRTKDTGTRFARLKKVLRKRSSNSIL